MLHKVAISKKQNGSALLMALIFSFVIMVMLTGLLYSFKMGLLTSKSIIKNSHEKVLGETYIANAKDDIDFTKSNEFEIGNSKFEVIVDEDNISSFFPKNNNAELFQYQQYNSYDDIYKAFNKGSKTDLVKRIIYNALVSNIYQNFDTDYIPINVPMINVAAITDYQAKGYRLNNGELEDEQKGFIGFIQKQNQQINIFTDKAKIGVPIPEGMDSDFKIKVGWNLEKGKWGVFLVIYDTTKLFTTSFDLDTILAEDVEGLESENEALGNEIGQWKTVSAGDSKGGGASVGQAFVAQNIFDVVWYFEDKDKPPQLMLVRKNDQKRGNRETLEAYYSIFSNSDGQYKMKLGDKLSLKAELTSDNVKLLVPDFANNLDASMVLIFHPNNQSKTLMNVSDFNYNGDHKVGRSLDTYIDGESFGEPTIVSKSDDSIYIITFEPEKLHRYEYQKGFGSFVSSDYGVNGIEKEFKFGDDESDNVVVGAKDSDNEDESDEGIQLVVPKFGYLFVFTKNKVMQLNQDLDILEEFDLEQADNPQILVDFDSVKNTINKVYIQSDALDNKAQEIRDELGDEDAPEDESEIDDKSNKSTEDTKNKSAREKRLEEMKKKQQGSDDESEEEEPPEPVYLNSKYLYPLGVVKQVIL